MQTEKECYGDVRSSTAVCPFQDLRQLFLPGKAGQQSGNPADNHQIGADAEGAGHNHDREISVITQQRGNDSGHSNRLRMAVADAVYGPARKQVYDADQADCNDGR